MTLADLKDQHANLNLSVCDAIKLRLLEPAWAGVAFWSRSFDFKRGMPVDADLMFDVALPAQSLTGSRSA